jgi:uncharacterized protein
MTERARVPCNGCRACCQGGELVVLFPERGDELDTYDAITVDSTAGTITVLKHKPNGDCVYLGERGCSIHGRAPAVCRVFDCRRYFLSLPRNERRVMERTRKAKNAIFAAARARLATLTDEQRRAALAHRSDVLPLDKLDQRKRLLDMLVSP